MTEKALSIKNLNKNYGNHKVLHDINMSIEKGEIVGLLGHNGAGKTTLIKTISGIIKNYSGTVEIYGNDIRTHYSNVINKVGVLIEPSFFEYMTAYQSLKYLSIAANTKNDGAIEEILDFVGLLNKRNEKVATFSFGMKQRLGLAQALMSNPDLLILDEPTVGLDPIGIRELKDKLKDLSAKNKIAIMFSSHQIKDVEDICTRVILLDKGNIRLDDETKEILNKKTYIFKLENGETLGAFEKVLGENNIRYETADLSVSIAGISSKELNDVLDYKSKYNINITDIDVRHGSLLELFKV